MVLIVAACSERKLWNQFVFFITSWSINYGFHKFHADDLCDVKVKNGTAKRKSHNNDDSFEVFVLQHLSCWWYSWKRTVHSEKSAQSTLHTLFLARATHSRSTSFHWPQIAIQKRRKRKRKRNHERIKKLATSLVNGFNLSCDLLCKLIHMLTRHRRMLTCNPSNKRTRTQKKFDARIESKWSRALSYNKGHVHWTTIANG